MESIQAKDWSEWMGYVERSSGTWNWVKGSVVSSNLCPFPRCCLWISPVPMTSHANHQICMLDWPCVYTWAFAQVYVYRGQVTETWYSHAVFILVSNNRSKSVLNRWKAVLVSNESLVSNWRQWSRSEENLLWLSAHFIFSSLSSKLNPQDCNGNWWSTSKDRGDGNWFCCRILYARDGALSDVRGRGHGTNSETQRSLSSFSTNNSIRIFSYVSMHRFFSFPLGCSAACTGVPFVPECQPHLGYLC